MRNKIVIIFISMVLSANVLYADNLQFIRTYINQNFSDQLNISEQQLEQLSWVVGHKRHTFEMDMYVRDRGTHVELTRALTRLYCLELLKTGGKAAYNKFITPQLQAKLDQPLSLHSFNKLSKQIKALHEDEYKLLSTATILSAVSLSEQANKHAQKVLHAQQSSNDNLEFISSTLRAQDNIYPLVDDKRLLYILFPPQTNFRHMLYSEGGIGMFNYLRIMIKHRYIKERELNLWYCFWVINIAGFRGHVAHNGSLYLTEQVFLAIQELKSNIDQMLRTPNFDPLVPYLEYRAKLLSLENLPTQEKLLLAHLAAMMRLYNVAEGAQLRRAFYQLSPNLRVDLLKYFEDSLHNNQHIYPTYAPALFSNMLELNNKNIAQALYVIIPVYLKAIKIYKQQLNNGNIKSGNYLSFNQLSSCKQLSKMLKLENKNIKLKVMSDGEVMLLEDYLL